ncbi:MAG TPA: NAD(P)-dependent alcohol dehydrogenase [Thermotogota bacterium]|nr:NAD(P)-dependent alcohol dehydrogenase [Thermotogota bacterium]HPR95706.1 NAD(P)-dependent alcohol dehydrogenase [Thermotogota bacterium]
MKAIVQDGYGSFHVLKFREIDKPQTGDEDVLIRNNASSVNGGNLLIMRGKPFLLRFSLGLPKPGFIVPGGDVAGIVEEIGKNVTQFKPGDAVFGDLSDTGFGAFAEYVRAPEKCLAAKPENISFEEAAGSAQAAAVAYQGLLKGKIKSGMKVLIYGASGGIGTFAVQIAKTFDTEVTAISSGRNHQLLYSLGADHCIDYKEEDFTKQEKKYDLILATVGYRSIFDYKNALSPTGIHVATGGDMKQILQPLFLGAMMSRSGGKTFTSLSHKQSQADLLFINRLFEEEKIKTVIDREFELKHTVDAMKYYAKRRTVGKVIITI